MSSLQAFIRSLPKAELHLHIEGTLEPRLLMKLAAKHGVALPYEDEAAVHAAYNFDNLQCFLDLYYMGAGVLIDENDFFELMWAYLSRCRDENIVHTEMMFDPQTHTDRGVGFDVFMPGFARAMQKAEAEWGQSSALIMCFLRHLDEDSALATLEAAKPYRDMIQSVGLDSSEVGHPPEKFTRAYAEAKQQGYELVAHAGEEGPPAYIYGALDVLGVSRIDHGVRCVDDESLVQRLIDEQIPLTVCPLSNVRLCVYEHMRDHNILSLLDKGVLATVNSDDPPYFGGYLMDNFAALEDHLGMTREQAVQLVRNSFIGSFLANEDKQRYLSAVDELA